MMTNFRLLVRNDSKNLWYDFGLAPLYSYESKIRTAVRTICIYTINTDIIHMDLRM